MGSVSLLQNVTFSTQPISSMDWSPDKVEPNGSSMLPYSGNFRKLLKVGFSRLKLSRIVEKDNGMPIDKDATVLNENFRS